MLITVQWKGWVYVCIYLLFIYYTFKNFQSDMTHEYFEPRTLIIILI